MPVMSDIWIRRMAQEHGMIDPFVETQKREGVISYGLSSYGYDARVSDSFKVFTNVDSAIVDPKSFNPDSFVDRRVPVCVIPPNSFALAHTMEYFLCPLRHHRERDPVGAGMGGAGDDRDQQHHPAASQDIRVRGHLSVFVPKWQ